MRRLLSLCLVVGFLLSSASTTPTIDVHPRLLNSITGLMWPSVELQSGVVINDVHCTTGYINAKEHYWITAAHCVAGLEENSDAAPEVTTANHAYTILGSPAIVVFADFDHDLAILQTIVDNNYTATPLKLAKAIPVWGTNVYMMGYPYGLGPVYSVGYVSNPNYRFPFHGWDQRDFILYNLAGCPGNSGSPVVNEKGEIVSILQVGIQQNCSPIMGGATLTDLRQIVGSFFR